MRWIRKLSAEVEEAADVIGGKAFGLVTLLRLGLPVPPGFVISAEACRVFLAAERFPDGLTDELAAATADLEGPVSVRSGAAVSMPGMMNTILDVEPVPERLIPAIEGVFSSWHTPRARTYRELHGIPHDLGTAVVVQTMVYGNRDEHSGAGVAFSRDPNTGAPVPFGEFLFGRHGEDVVSGRSLTSPLRDLEPLVRHDLLDALNRVEAHYRDACYLEFTFEAGKLWLLQARSGRFTGRAAVRVAVDLVDEGTISRDEALRRVSAQDLEDARTPRIAPTEILARGTGASPGVATGRVATTPEAAVRMAGDGPVILVRPETSPLDMNGLAVAAGVVTARGGPASHAAIVARTMRKPAVVGVAGVTVDGAVVRVGGRILVEGTVVTIDGTGGEVVAGSAPVVTAGGDPHLRRLLKWRLLA